MKTFPLASMSAVIRWFTVALMVLPITFVSLAALGKPPGAWPAVLVVVIYAWIWFGFRPTQFIVHADALEVVWPLKRRVLPRADITGVRLIDRRDLRSEIGWGLRVGAGGLWGAFGSLWTQRRGVVKIYISRTDGFVWIDRGSEQPWLITPERPEEFVRALSG